jgi:hypothetical protein
VELEGVRLLCSGKLILRRHLVSCRSPSECSVALGSESLKGGASEAHVNIPGSLGFAHVSPFASPCGFGSSSRSGLGSVVAGLFAAQVAAGAAVAVSHTPNSVFKPTAVPALRFNQSLPRGGGLTRC